MRELNEARRARLAAILVESLRQDPLLSPERAESETSFTRRCLRPLLDQKLSALGFPGLLLLGTGAAPMISCYMLGANFYPDLAIAYFGDAVFAVEVKFLRNAQRQNAIATAIGQAVIYSQRYENVAVVLIDAAGRISHEEASLATELLDSVPISLILRGATREGTLSSHRQSLEPAVS